MSKLLPAWVTTTSVAEFLVISAVLIKVYQYFAAPLRGEFERNLNLFSIALLFVSIFVMLRQVGQRLGSVDAVSKQVGAIADELERRDRAGRYGLGAASVASLLDLARRQGNYAHSQSGGRILSHLLLEVFTDAAHDLSRLAKGEKTSVELVEYHLVDRFVHELIDSLPTGSAWIGLSRLQNVDAWEQQTSHAHFHEFQKAVERRCKNEEINYLRLWCFDSDSDRQGMAAILERQKKAGLVQRWIVEEGATDDFSLIWAPKRALSIRTEICDPEAPMDAWDSSESELVPLCGIRFKTRGGRELEGMTIYSPDTEDFRHMQVAWERRWVQAMPV